MIRAAQRAGSGRSALQGALWPEDLVVGGRREVDGQGVLDVAVGAEPLLALLAGPADGLVEGQGRWQQARAGRDVEDARAHDAAASGARRT